MNKGKNRWVVGTSNQGNELWSVRLDVQNQQRLSTREEYLIFKTGFVNYWAIDFLFGIFAPKGQCISGELHHPEGRKKSNELVFRKIQTFKDNERQPFKEDETLDRLLYLEKLYKLTHHKMLTLQEYELFKKMFHAIQRDEYETVITILKDYKPKDILNQTSK